MIEIKNLSKYYGDFPAVDDISFEVPKGQILGFLGPNGAGKTTTVRVVTGFLPPTYGTVLVDGYDISSDSIEVRKRIGYLPENTPLYTEMNVIDYLKFIVDMRKDGISRPGKRIKQVVEQCGLGDVTYKDIGELSKGFRQRVGIAQAMVHDPPILILDEPTAGLDPNQIVEIRRLIKDLGREKTVILCSHILPEVEATCARVVIIHNGKIAADGSPKELQASSEGKGTVYIQIKGAGPELTQKLESVPGVERVTDARNIGENISDFTLEVFKGADPREDLFRLCVHNNLVLLEMNRREISLEDVFHALTKAEGM
ncbi:MAG: ATP-binding cassette domain-containing protein [candidate division Zixibacteria bacterium]|nr:ATP-binding cassette domain-containing protein [candidate division Zixibacteria bacterium]MBU1471984.1 ATP-binding cassette domain-containing protein [candidate division Zixibacteria bacterium]MBU2626915.1 ATP-binding cassette domain-containing protein [candidate division Zixibacteria bacterium]